ncbi:4-hydroxythreonine-4-phosphate dehydrogenase : 4-hydroxythreonine-4-phosphate dehydrogenase OS=Opitutus terrae (strain DSM 11246 / PB90-1) GN=pdxA PE=3 SV=1: PdxA [Gemmataceae bacterium]|nr:4-hydroxythreonine-4-phosphate dehydrogenase : 4-hydroxythreonine-4-phosphate dehydrogenase OS=Opitutus terrae (strain DSM 11246 / PB90-1) GN=pdxA PE=3 SV=1: PdxA [Gemmataceae bacterium]VTT99800.1 4-hydroxythreonine-4-phosphate dehydrogenase : 4-hydroxythreonine-4-phosphate dehydrogenase OS=Opitutus terrae (strain DSM 11246 / PB90-1) GN=pdxA PE=3 SV=1: PdxA [Gemmataceae bacterium]
MTTLQPRIAVTMGDPAGVGPELCLRLLASEAVREACVPVVFGDARVLAAAAEACRLPVPATVVALDRFLANPAATTGPAVADFARLAPRDFVIGQVSGPAGAAGFAYIEAAIRAALAGTVDAVCTAPIHKEALAAAGVKFPGHTEIFTALTGARRSCMMLTSSALTCSFVTGHVGYRDVPGLLSEQRVLDVIELTAAAVRRLRGRAPRLVVCGLNPHAGEHGLFGDREEERFIAPAVERARAAGLAVEGPVPPDTAFLAPRRKGTDAVVCMYHDQGHIPLKALAFDEAINVTLGLPIVRTSVDHGTAFDIAWQGKASPTSLFEAVLLAARLAGGRGPAPEAS